MEIIHTISVQTYVDTNKGSSKCIYYAKDGESLSDLLYRLSTEIRED